MYFQEEEEWEKVRQIDNPILPWSVKYAPDVGAHNMGHGRPHFYTVSKIKQNMRLFCGVTAQNSEF